MEEFGGRKGGREDVELVERKFVGTEGIIGKNWYSDGELFSKKEKRGG